MASKRIILVLPLLLLLILALDCFAQKPMSLWRLKHQDIYVLDEDDIPRFTSKETYRVVSPTTDRTKVYRLWVDCARIEKMSLAELNFSNLQELRICRCYIPRDLTQYPLLQVLDYFTDVEVCQRQLSNDDYVNLMVSPLPEQIFQLKNLKELNFERGTSVSFFTEKNISKLKKLKYLRFSGKFYIPAYLCRKENFSSTTYLDWQRKPIIDFLRHIYKKRTYRNEGYVLKAHYKKGKPDGEWLVYGKNGEIVQRRFYKNGLEHGNWLIRWKNNYEEDEFLEYEFDNGTLISIKESYYGSCRVIENFNDFSNRKEKFFGDDGECYEENVYKDDNLIRTYKRFGNDTEYITQDIVDTVGGKIYYEKKYVNDTLVEEKEYFYKEKDKN